MWDCFLCHAVEDKIDFVDPLVNEMSKLGYRIWYDKFEIGLGDSLSKKINEGLKGSINAILVFSPSFLSGKKWTEAELFAIDALEKQGKIKILPIWYKVTEKEIAESYPLMLDRFAVEHAKIGLLGVVNALKRAIDPTKGTRVIEPIYEKIAFRFITGDGDVVVNNENGPAMNAYEAIVHLKDEEYPIICGTNHINKSDILYQMQEMYDPLTCSKGKSDFPLVGDEAEKFWKEYELFNQRKRPFR